MKSGLFVIGAGLAIAAVPALADVTAMSFDQLSAMISASPQVGSCKLALSPLMKKAGKKTQAVGTTITLTDTKSGHSVFSYYETDPDWNADQSSKGIVDNPPQQSPHSSFHPDTKDVGWVEFDMIYANTGFPKNHPQRKNLMLFYNTKTKKVVGATLIDYQEDSTNSTLFESGKTVDGDKLKDSIVCGDTGMITAFDSQANPSTPGEINRYYGEEHAPAAPPVDPANQSSSSSAVPANVGGDSP